MEDCSQGRHRRYTQCPRYAASCHLGLMATWSLNVDAYACSRVMRVTPLDLHSSPSVCLMKHILSDKVVTLVTPKKQPGLQQEGKATKAGTFALFHFFCNAKRHYCFMHSYCKSVQSRLHPPFLPATCCMLATVMYSFVASMHLSIAQK